MVDITKAIGALKQRSPPFCFRLLRRAGNSVTDRSRNAGKRPSLDIYFAAQSSDIAKRHRDMPRPIHKPQNASLADSATATSPDKHSRRQCRLIACGYALGLLLTFILSLLLLPPDVGVGKLLWCSLGAFSG